MGFKLGTCSSNGVWLALLEGGVESVVGKGGRVWGWSRDGYCLCDCVEPLAGGGVDGVWGEEELCQALDGEGGGGKAEEEREDGTDSVGIRLSLCCLAVGNPRVESLAHHADRSTQNDLHIRPVVPVGVGE